MSAHPSQSSTKSEPIDTGRCFIFNDGQPLRIDRDHAQGVFAAAGLALDEGTEVH